ncbi:FA complementation group M [Lasioglossum baleicum]|uniref:FA complementation group M n=1 Tax=Lasioglossum baleicum TaxID=434251 RepID=UPI003FCC7A20
MELSQNVQISSDPGTKGFDLSAGGTWIYPENYPVRDYQFNVVKASLYCNTLVCLPTGLGKTFIAAVVMYNFWRWYPCGKVVFLAPTKPLVTQQIFACHNVMGIPTTETIELTGAVNQKQREVAWCKQRVIFATPQVFHNDLEKNIVPANLVKCVVIDEAHKALGKHSYCECIKILNEKNKNYRLLALSATPGNKIDNVHEVIQNLCIAHIELRDDTSPDIIPYINQRKVDIILVPLNNELTEYKEQYISIMDRHVRVLIQSNVLRGHTANISKGKIFYLLKEFQKKGNRPGNNGQIMKTLNILMTMYHAYELMVRDGLRAFLKFYHSHSDKFWMNEEIHLQELLENIERYLGEFPDVKTLSPDSEIPQNLIFGHTKFEKLKELLEHHFKRNQNGEDDTRAIVFVEYRDIVSEVYVLLLQCRPLIRPQMFVGQAGQKQKQQIKALDDFRNNRVNVLISTSIGEEGLDVGEVDLIICFDISQNSPTRLVQRMGRTGRKRDGHIIILVTDGREHETLKTTIARRDSLNNKVLKMDNILSSLYQDNPRMIPESLIPECLKMHIHVQPKTPTVKGKNEKKKLDKKSTKSKKVSKKTAATESNAEPQCGKTKSLMDFFQSRKDEDVVDEDFKVPTMEPTRNIKVSKMTKPNDVKILSCDTAAIDFLTTCAMRNSQKDTSIKETDDISDLYLPKFSLNKDFFQFSIPDPSILDCLVTLDEVVRRKREEKMISDEYDIGYRSSPCGNNDDANNGIDDQVFMETIPEIEYNDCIAAVSKFEDLLDDSNESKFEDLLDDSNESKFEDLHDNSNESKFEDLLDDSSKSNESDGFEEEDKENKNNVCLVKDFGDLSRRTDYDEEVATNNTFVSHNFEPGTFEDILNDTSDSECASESAQVAEAGAEASSKYYDVCKTVDVKTPVKSLKVEDVEFGSFTASNRSEDAIENNVTSNRYIEKKSLLSVTQAISEIALINSNPDSRATALESDDDMFKDEFDADLADVPDFEPEVKYSIAQSQLDTRYSFKQIEPEIKCSFEQKEPEVKCSLKQIQPEVNVSTAQSQLEMKTSFKQIQPQMKCSFKQKEPEMECSTEQTAPTVIRDSDFREKKTFDAEFAIDDYIWNDDFEVCDSEETGGTSNWFKEEKTKSQGGACSFLAWDSDDDWISVEKSAKKPTSGTSIARKLAGAKKRLSLKCDSTRNVNDRATNTVDVQSNFFLKDKKKSVEFDTSYFFEDVKENFESERVNSARSKSFKALSSLSNERKRRRRRARNEFIDDEAQVSSNDEADTTDGSSGTDQDLEDFVSYTQNVHDTSDMRAHYLRTIRSPVKRHDGFIFKEPRAVDTSIEIYSQPVSQSHESYLNDTFCVGEDEESVPVEELSELEKAEQELERRKRKRGRDAGYEENTKKRRKRNRRINVINHSSSSEDETAILREQIKEESFMIAQRSGNRV